MNDRKLIEAADKAWNKSNERTWEIGRLGIPNGSGYDIEVADRPGYVYVSRGDNGELGAVIAQDKVSVALVGNQRVRMRRENGRLIIREAEQYRGNGGATMPLSALSDVLLTGLADGDKIEWDSGTGKWINVVGAGTGGAPSPHALSGIHHSGSLIWVMVDKTGSNLTDIDTRNHSDLQGVTANQHHNQVHVLATNTGLGGDHTISGATAGHVLRASAANAAAFAQLQHADLGGVTADQHHNQVHSITGSDHTITASQYQIVGATATNTLGLLTPSSNPGAAAAILRTDSNGGIALDTSLLVVNGATDVITIDTSLVSINASTDIVTFDTSVLAINASTDIVTFDTTLLVINASANTIAMDTDLFVLTAGTNTITSAAAWTFSGNIIANADVTHNTGVFTHNTDPQVSANLDFIGGDRSITASNKLTIAPTGDLLLDPTGSILLPDAQEMKTETFSDLVTGIAGFRLWDRGSNYRQLTLGALKADEMYVRVFVADEVRIDRGEEYWSKSYGVVETDFTLPADEATVDVWFENAAALADADLFSTNDWLLCRAIDWDTGLTIVKVWFQVISRLTAGTVDGVKQQWRLRRKNGGSTGFVVKAGNTILDAGQEGQGWVHLSALDQDGGPFIQIGEMTDDSTADPTFTNYVRMGNLNGTVDYAADTWGFAAGSNLGTAPSAGFSGLTADAANGMRLYNVDLSIYDGSTLVTSLDKTLGLQLLDDTSAFADERRFIEWKDSLPSGTRTSALASYVASSGPPAVRSLTMSRNDSDGRTEVMMLAVNSGYSAYVVAQSSVADGTVVQVIGEKFRAVVNYSYLESRVSIADSGYFNAVSRLHVKESTTATSTTAGATIEQGSTGDAVLHFLLTGGQRIMMGIDNSDSDKFKIGDSTDLASGNILTIDPATNFVGIGTASPILVLDVRGASAIRHLATGSSGGITFQNIVDAGNSNSRMAVAHNAIWNFTDDVWEFAAIGANDGQAMTVDGNGNWRWIHHTSTGNTARTMSHATFHAGAKMRLLNDGTWSIAGAALVGAIGTPASRLQVYEDTSNTGATAGVTIENDGTGDAVVQFLLTGVQRWMAGIDNSVTGDPFVISSTGNLSGATFSLTTAGALTLGGGLNTGGSVDVFGNLDISADLDVGGDAVIGDDLTVNGTGYVLERLSVGSSSAPGAFVDVHGEAAGDTAPMVRASFYGTGTSRYSFLGRRARTSIASPAAVQSGDVIMALGGLGYTSSGWSSTASGEISFSAAEAYTGSGRGTKMTFWVVKIGGSSAAIALDLGDDRQIFAPGAYAFTTANAANVNVNTDGQLRLSTSARRFKTDIRPMPVMPEVFDRLQPVLYKPAEGVGGQGRDWPGLIAEDVADAGGTVFVTYNDRGQADYVMYDRLVVLTIGEVQALKRRVAELERKVGG